MRGGGMPSHIQVSRLSGRGIEENAPEGGMKAAEPVRLRPSRGGSSGAQSSPRSLKSPLRSAVGRNDYRRPRSGDREGPPPMFLNRRIRSHRGVRVPAIPPYPAVPAWDVCAPRVRRARIALTLPPRKMYGPGQLMGVSLREHRGQGCRMEVARHCGPLGTTCPRGPFSFWTEYAVEPV
jgi:hypothetical protein